MNKHRTPGEPCPLEYVAADLDPKFRWKGEGPPPPSWMAGNTKVYRSYADYVDD